MSSRKPMIGVRATASIMPSRRGGGGGRASTTPPFALVTIRQRRVIGRLRRGVEHLKWLDIGIGLPLQFGSVEAGIIDWCRAGAAG